MANVALVSFLLIVTCQVGAGTAWPWEWLSGNEACAEPGAVREEAQGAVSVCVAGEGWRRVPTYTGLDDLLRATPRAAPDCTGLPGQMVCDTTCSIEGVCLDNGGWLPTKTCANNELCINGECVNDPTATCPYKEVRCVTSGKYPSLLDCSHYYECDGTSPAEPQPCSEDTIFNACTEVCDIKLSASEECSWAISDPCTEPGAFGVAPNNDRLFYACVQGTSGVYVLWERCKTGHFNLTSQMCDNASEPGCGVIPTTTSTTTTTTFPPPLCTAVGVTENPYTNCSYYYCYPNGTYLLIVCLDDYYYEPSYGGCTPGQCS